MKAFSRYAVYFAPEAGYALARFGANWLGWDAQTGQEQPHPENTGLPVITLTQTQRNSGMHVTLKPPFRLAKGTTVEGLDAAIVELAGQHRRFEIAQIALHSIDGFMAITPASPCPALADLACACVQKLDAFRAPPSDAELARRRLAGLSVAPERNPMRWVYPYVLEEVRFHLTLPGRLDPKETAPVRDYLQSALAAPLEAPLPVAEICLFGEALGGNFHIIKRYALSA